MHKKVLQTCSVLYAEDDEKVRESVGELLGRYFGTVYTAKDGQEAWELYQTHMPDAIITDIDMPHLGGLELTEMIRQENEQVPVLILTAYTDTPKMLKATELLLVKYLLKPVELQAFREALKKIAERIVRNREHIIGLSAHMQWLPRSHTFLYNGQRVSLTEKEGRILSLLVQAQGECVTSEQVMAEVWGDAEEEVTKDALKFHISSLRKKLPEGLLRNVYGKGYMLTI